MIKILDTDKDGKISKSEFDLVISDKFKEQESERASVRELHQLFCVFDRNKDGYIEWKDFTHILNLVSVLVLN